MRHNNKTENYTEFYYHFFRNILLVSLPLLIVFTIALSLPHSSAVNNSSSDYVSINLPSSCTLVTSGNNSHITNMVSGQLKENIGSTEINTLCNDKNGYVVYAKGITQNGLNEPVLSSPIGPSYDIKTGNIPSTNSNSSWALKLNPVASDYSPTVVDTYNNKYAPVPSDWTKVVSRSSGTSTNTDISDNVKSAFTTTYAVYTTPSQPAGTYSGQVQFMLLRPSTADNLATTIDNAFFLANKTRLILKTDGTTVEEGSEGSEDIPAEDIVGRYYRMQDMDAGICGTVTYVDTASEAQLIDVRDNKTYYVTKLQDGNCWMTQNLALDLETIPTNVAPLTSENTDLNDNSLSGAYELGYMYENNVLTWRPANATINFSGTSMSGWNNSNYNIMCSARKTDGTLTGHTAAGNYYNWSATIASNNSSSYVTSTYGDVSKNPQNSICPKGWRLPTISSVTANNEFAKLNNLYNSGSATSDAGLIASPLWFAHSGLVRAGGLNNYGANGGYWSSTVHNGNYAYFLSFSNSSANPATSSDGYSYYNGKTLGRSIRCLAR
ncbi:hypothetical protein IIY68_02065 [Candidatus Saccharibacteria bacterium]|nr:hypothetical protein [Candidatus Saccharibacteria bacterium]